MTGSEKDKNKERFQLQFVFGITDVFLKEFAFGCGICILAPRSLLKTF